MINSTLSTIFILSSFSINKWKWILVLILYSYGCTNRPVASHYYDEDWNTCEKDSAQYFRVIKYDSNANPLGVVKDYYINGKLQFEGYLISENPPILDSTCIWYHKNGRIQCQGTYKAGELNGEEKIYNDKGVLMSQKTVFNDMYEGIHMQFYEDGTLKEQCEYENGLIKDTCLKYHPNGQLDQITIRYVKNGDVFVLFKRYQPDGTLFQDYGSKNGQMYGINLGYYPNGKLHYRREYNEEGNIVVEKKYDENGVLISE